MARMWVAPKLIAGATSGMLGFVMKITRLYKEGDGYLIMSVGAGMMFFTVLMMGGIMRIRINRVQSKDSSMSNGSDVESERQSAPHHHDVGTDGSRAKVCKSMKKLNSDDDQYSSSSTATDDIDHCGLQKEDIKRRSSSPAHNMISCCMPACLSSYVHMKRYLSLSSSKKRLLGSSNSDAGKKMINVMEEGLYSVVAAPEIKSGEADELIRISDRRTTVMHVDNKEISGDLENHSDDTTTGHCAEGLLWQRSIMLGERCEPPAFSGVILYDEHGNLVPEFPCKSPAHRRSIINHLHNIDDLRTDATAMAAATLHGVENNATSSDLMTPTSSPGAAAGFHSSPSSVSLRQLMTSH